MIDLKKHPFRVLKHAFDEDSESSSQNDQMSFIMRQLYGIGYIDQRNRFDEDDDDDLLDILRLDHYRRTGEYLYGRDSDDSDSDGFLGYRPH